MNWKHNSFLKTPCFLTILYLNTEDPTVGFDFSSRPSLSVRKTQQIHLFFIFLFPFVSYRNIQNFWTTILRLVLFIWVFRIQSDKKSTARPFVDILFGGKNLEKSQIFLSGKHWWIPCRTWVTSSSGKRYQKEWETGVFHSMHMNTFLSVNWLWYPCEILVVEEMIVLRQSDGKK